MQKGGVVKKLVFFIALVGGLLHLINSATGFISPFVMRPVHLGTVGFIGIIMELSKLKDKKFKGFHAALNVIALVFVVLGCGYFGANYADIAKSAGYVTPEIVVFGSMLVLSVLYLSWKTVGASLSIVATVFVLYALFGQYLPGSLGHRGYSFKRVINFLYTNGNGIFGVPIDTSARYLVLFMIMAEFIERSGTGKLFMAFADAIAKRTRGGAAKASIVSSALFGSISGSPIANVMVTGVFTIPMMKKSGFTPEFAGGVEATASTGGLIMPPIMGAGAFLMAEILGVSYGKVMIAAVIPAIMYYLSLYLAVDFYAARNNIDKVITQRDNIPHRVKTYLHTAIPLVIFIVLVSIGYSVFMSAIVSIVLTPIVAAFRKETRMTFRSIIEGFAEGMKKSVSLGAACACAGIIVGSISLTGFGFSFAALLEFFSTIPILAFLITMVICVVMGMGMPAVASYLITATIAAPSLIKMGFLPIAVHMFIFYYSSFSSVTPPVALASYAAAGLAGTDPWKTGNKAFKLALVAFLAPFIFVYSPALLGQSGLFSTLTVFLTSILGVFAFVCGIQGYWGRRMDNWILRIIMIAAGCLMIIPGLITDIIGIVAATAVFFINRAIEKRPAAPAT